MGNSERTTLVLGASENTSRYANIAAKRLMNHNEKVYLVGKTKGSISGHQIHNTWPENLNFHTLTLYVNPKHQVPYYQLILDSKPERVIFNPGAENPELAKLLNENNIEFENACTLVLLATGQY